MRTAYHTIIYEAEDFTVGLFDADGNTISIGLGLPMFIRGLSDAIKAKIAHWGKENIHPGDILLTNDSYIMGSHLNHMIYHAADIQRRRIGGVLVVDGALAGYRRSAGRRDPGYFFRRVADAFRQTLSRGSGESRDHRDHQGQRARAASARWAICARSWRRSAPASGASCICSSATATRHSKTASSSSTSRAKNSRARRCGRFPTAFTKPSRSWTMTASISANIFRSRCASKSKTMR